MVAADPTTIEHATDEDVHSFVERELVARVGDLGKKLHTGRSRNDQVVTDLRLHLRSVCAELATELACLVTLAAKRATAAPGRQGREARGPVLTGNQT